MFLQKEIFLSERQSNQDKNPVDSKLLSVSDLLKNNIEKYKNKLDDDIIDYYYPGLFSLPPHSKKDIYYKKFETKKNVDQELANYKANKRDLSKFRKIEKYLGESDSLNRSSELIDNLVDTFDAKLEFLEEASILEMVTNNNLTENKGYSYTDLAESISLLVDQRKELQKESILSAIKKDLKEKKRFIANYKSKTIHNYCPNLRTMIRQICYFLFKNMDDVPDYKLINIKLKIQKNIYNQFYNLNNNETKNIKSIY